MSSRGRRHVRAEGRSVGPDGIRARGIYAELRGIFVSSRNLVYARNLGEKANRFIINCKLDKMKNKDCNSAFSTNIIGRRL
jgi:hypothetical protein